MFGSLIYVVYKVKYLRLFTCLLILLAMASTHAQPSAANEISLQQKLKNYTWQNRVLLVIADTQKNTNFKEQQHILTQRQTQLQDRDLEILYLPLNEVSQADKTFLIEQFNIQEKIFCAILIGKDGGEKLRSAKPLPVDNLFETIDAMPMRKQEMKKNGL